MEVFNDQLKTFSCIILLCDNLQYSKIMHNFMIHIKSLIK